MSVKILLCTCTMCIYASCMPKNRTNIMIDAGVKNAAVASIALAKNKTGKKARNFSNLIEELLKRHLANRGQLPKEFATK